MGQGKIAIGEVVKQLNVTAKQLQDWGKAGLIEEHMTPTGREYDEEMLERIEFIRDDLAAQREHGKPSLDKTKEKLQIQSMLVDKKDQEKALQMDTSITNSLEKVLHNTGFIEVLEQMGAAYNTVIARLNDVTAELQQTREENKQLREALPNPQQQRLERFNERMTEKRITRALRKGAEAQWAKNPVMKKAGIFSKSVEDLTAKEQFIQTYIDEHFENEMKKEYGIEGGNL